MESELWPVVYRLLGEEAKRRPRPKGVWYSDGRILEVYLWAAVHDRPTCWALRAADLAAAPAAPPTAVGGADERAAADAVGAAAAGGGPGPAARVQ